MALDPQFMEYPNRRYGQDHDRYDWSLLYRRAPVHWPDGARIALYTSCTVQWFPQDMGNKPFAVPGGMVMPYPDLRHYSLREYGPRVGVFKLAELAARRGVRVSCPMNAAVAARTPYLVHRARDWGWELMGHGLDMGHPHHGGLEVDAERDLIDRSLETLRSVSGQDVTGWLSPAQSQSPNTPDLLAARGVTWCCDWGNDDMPYAFRTAAGEITAFPHTHEWSDQTVLVDYRQGEDQWVAQVCAAFDLLHAEAGGEVGGKPQGGRILHLPLQAWCAGQPHRLWAVEAILDHILAHDGVWSATGSEIVGAWKAAQAT